MSLWRSDDRRRAWDFDPLPDATSALDAVEILKFRRWLVDALQADRESLDDAPRPSDLKRRRK